MRKYRNWPLAILAVVGAFLVAGVIGALGSEALGLWDTPGAGFCAALAVVLTSYFATPGHRLVSSLVSCTLGVVLAWYFLEPSWYPEHYAELAYQPTHLPLIATYLGAVFGFVFIGALKLWRKRRAGKSVIAVVP
jgi:hypothetical protein